MTNARLAVMAIVVGGLTTGSALEAVAGEAGGQTDLAAAGAQFLKSCGTCHTVEPKAEIRQGPNLSGVIGRTAGTLAEFPTYSEALKKAGAGGLVWTEEALDKWITASMEMVPDSAMPYSQPDPEKRKLVIAYLKSLPVNGGGAK
ncbi:MAG: c-type cytochrome [Hyphomicrobium sp.]